MKITGVCLLVLFLNAMCSCDKNDHSRTTPDNTLLKKDSFWIPDAWKIKFKTAQTKTFQIRGQFSEIKAEFIIEASSLYIDSNNSVLADAKVTLLKGSKNCEFHCTMEKKQYNQQSGSNVNTFADVLIDFYRRENSNIKYRSKEYVIESIGNISESLPKGIK